jgi:hypothetical protein
MANETNLSKQYQDNPEKLPFSFQPAVLLAAQYVEKVQRKAYLDSEKRRLKRPAEILLRFRERST